jgi:two-component system sensor histidine kinase PilS (NtrC family)
MAANAQDRGGDNRRQADRRRNDRRRTDRSSIDESWFAMLGVNVDSRVEQDEYDDLVESRLAAWEQPDQEPADSKFITRQALRLISGGGSAFQRIHRTFITARAALGMALVVAQVAGRLWGVSPGLPLSTVVCLLYAAQALAMWLLPRFQQPATPRGMARMGSSQWLATIGMDLLTFSVLHLIEPGANFNYVALLVLPVLMAGVLTPRLMALGVASFIALMLLVGAWRAGLRSGEFTATMTQAGLAGIGFFVISLLAGELAGRLAREELTARGSLELARQQAQLNRLVIEHMQDGVMVVDRRGRVRTANPAARLLLGAHSMCRPAPFMLPETLVWRPLAEAVQRAFREGSWPEAGREVALVFEPGLSRTLIMRVRFTRRLTAPGNDGKAGEELCVLFLEDLRSVQGRTRQEKLAAMGRVSAGIAHEIRNPLAAISQANALLEEDPLTPDQHRLTRMVGENAERLKRIVEDVLEVAPGTAPVHRVIDGTAEVAKICSEWSRTAQLPLNEHSRLRVKLPAQPVGVVFEPEHLRRVLVNLLDNGRRHASETAGAVRLELKAIDERKALLMVSSDGPPNPPQVERHHIEPIFSTPSRGPGLGG